MKKHRFVVGDIIGYSKPDSHMDRNARWIILTAEDGVYTYGEYLNGSPGGAVGGRWRDGDFTNCKIFVHGQDGLDRILEKL